LGIQLQNNPFHHSGPDPESKITLNEEKRHGVSFFPPLQTSPSNFDKLSYSRFDTKFALYDCFANAKILWRFSKTRESEKGHARVIPNFDWESSYKIILFTIPDLIRNPGIIAHRI